MTPYTHNHQQRSGGTQTAHERANASGPAEPNRQGNAFVSQRHEQAARSVMHPDHSDPDWRYYFGAMTN